MISPIFWKAKTVEAIFHTLNGLSQFLWSVIRSLVGANHWFRPKYRNLYVSVVVGANHASSTSGLIMQVVLLAACSFSEPAEVLVDSTWANRLRDCLVVLAIEKFTNDYQNNNATAIA